MPRTYAEEDLLAGQQVIATFGEQFIFPGGREVTAIYDQPTGVSLEIEGFAPSIEIAVPLLAFLRRGTRVTRKSDGTVFRVANIPPGGDDVNVVVPLEELRSKEKC